MRRVQNPATSRLLPDPPAHFTGVSRLGQAALRRGDRSRANRGSKRSPWFAVNCAPCHCRRASVDSDTTNMLGRLLLTAAVVLAAIHGSAAQFQPTQNKDIAMTECPDGQPLVHCTVDPCSTVLCPARTQCVSNYCGGCNAVCVPIKPPVRCTSWTNWFDRDNPSVTGDWETLSNLQEENPGMICKAPTAIEARVVGTGQDALATGENFAFCDATTGFVCRKDDQPDNECLDYEVRFCCPETDSDSVLSGSGRPGSTVEASLAGEVLYKYDTTSGFACRKVDQDDNTCLEYEVRFCCPHFATRLPGFQVHLGGIALVSRLAPFCHTFTGFSGASRRDSTSVEVGTKCNVSNWLSSQLWVTRSCHASRKSDERQPKGFERGNC
uniref:WxxW domain-containing protein n=1 Tax=Branchiostoma floridae TaxID=7739 RepID=C4A0K4_BRAFL|eukprot:XP_002585663.1 hypothetical protein BRAFLDRAFT_111593 [Branchiostoma floridae]